MVIWSVTCVFFPLILLYEAPVMHFAGGWCGSCSPTTVDFRLRFEGSGDRGGHSSFKDCGRKWVGNPSLCCSSRLLTA